MQRDSLRQRAAQQLIQPDASIASLSWCFLALQIECLRSARVNSGVRCSPHYLARTYNRGMKIKVVVHEAEEGGYWAEVPAIPGCATQGETFEELLKNLYEAVEGCLSVDVSPARV